MAVGAPLGHALAVVRMVGVGLGIVARCGNRRSVCKGKARSRLVARVTQQPVVAGLHGGRVRPVGAGFFDRTGFAVFGAVGVMAAAAAQPGGLIGAAGSLLHIRSGFLSQTEIGCNYVVAMGGFVTLLRLAMGGPHKSLVHPVKVPARFVAGTVAAENVVRPSAFMAVETGGARIRADGQMSPCGSHGQLRVNWQAVLGVVHGVATVTVGHTAVMESQGRGAPSQANQNRRQQSQQ